MKSAKNTWVWRGASGLLMFLLLTSCGGGGSGSSPPAVNPPPPPVAQITASQAARFLTQATFGARQTDIDQLVSSNSYDNWISSQQSMPATLQLPQIPASGTSTALRNARIEAWWNTAINYTCQIRSNK